MRRLVMLALSALLINSFGALGTPSTQIWIPSTDIQQFKKLHVGWDIYAGTYTDGLLSNGGLTIGILPFSKLAMEIGIDYRDINGVHKDPLYFNAKLGIPENSFSSLFPSVAIGGYDFGTKKDFSTYNIVYGEIAKTLPLIGRFSLGGYYGGIGVKPKVLFSSLEDGTLDNAGVLASWDRVMTEISNKLWLAVDFQSGNNGYGALSFGGSYNFSDNASFILGYDIYNASEILKPTITLQFDINLF